MVLCVPAIDKSRYYSVQLTDLYTFNYGYIGTRASGTAAGCYMVTGPGWKGELPAGVKRIDAPTRWVEVQPPAPLDGAAVVCGAAPPRHRAGGGANGRRPVGASGWREVAAVVSAVRTCRPLHAGARR